MKNKTPQPPGTDSPAGSLRETGTRPWSIKIPLALLLASLACTIGTGVWVTNRLRADLYMMRTDKESHRRYPFYIR